jgi:hypothetical protein
LFRRESHVSYEHYGRIAASNPHGRIEGDRLILCKCAEFGSASESEIDLIDVQKTVSGCGDMDEQFVLGKDWLRGRNIEFDGGVSCLESPHLLLEAINDLDYRRVGAAHPGPEVR